MMLCLCSITFGYFGGLFSGWLLYRPGGPELILPAPEKRQGDGSLVLETRPQVGGTTKPPHELPRGSREERRVTVTVRPAKKPQPPATTNIPPALDCPPVSFDLSLVANEDGTRRVVASSPDGEVTGGLDIPMIDLKPAKKTPWSLSYLRTTDDENGLALSRDVGPVVLGVAATDGGSAWLSVGVRF